MKIVDLLHRVISAPRIPRPPAAKPRPASPSPPGEAPEARFLRIFSETLREKWGVDRPLDVLETYNVTERYRDAVAHGTRDQRTLDRLAREAVPEPLVHRDLNSDGWGTSGGGSWRRLEAWTDLGDVVGHVNSPPPPSERTELPPWLPSAKARRP